MSCLSIDISAHQSWTIYTSNLNIRSWFWAAGLLHPSGYINIKFKNTYILEFFLYIFWNFNFSLLEDLKLRILFKMQLGILLFVINSNNLLRLLSLPVNADFRKIVIKITDWQNRRPMRVFLLWEFWFLNKIRLAKCYIFLLYSKLSMFNLKHK